MNAQSGFPTRGFDFLKDVDVRLSVELGRTDMKLKDVLALGEESVVMLERLTDELLDVMVNGKVIAKGEIVHQARGDAQIRQGAFTNLAGAALAA